MKIRIRLTREDNAQRHGVSVGSVIALDVESYLKGVLPAEIYESRTPREAKKAQAIAAHLTAARSATRPRARATAQHWPTRRRYAARPWTPRALRC